METSEEKKIRLEKEIAEKRELIKGIDAKLSGKISADVDSYEVWSDIAKRKLDRIPLKDLLAVRDVYKSELTSLEAELKKTVHREPRTIIHRFRD